MCYPGKWAAITSAIFIVLFLGALLGCYFGLLSKERDLQAQYIQAKDCHSIDAEVWDYKCNRKICNKQGKSCHEVVFDCYAINVTLQYSAEDANGTVHMYQFVYVDRQYDLETLDSAEDELPYLEDTKFHCYYSRLDHSKAKVGSISTTPGVATVAVFASLMFCFLVLLIVAVVFLLLRLANVNLGKNDLN